MCFRYEQLAEQEEHSYQHLRRKLYSELQQERDRLAAEMHGQRDLLERQMKELRVSQIYICCTKRLLERAFEDVGIVLFNAGIICKPTGSSEIRPGIVGSRNAQETWGEIICPVFDRFTSQAYLM